ncbi:MAG: NAD(P)/FAD-dependent oxidoreductase [Acidobacteria bacterium]|nr:NAD(P)/FAD-dependent oxidoreductase [Acidobacteriota bacterium]MBI3427670.1 NAD(P)/FAD-dependent oxidoreductase [Acidobacteriota bacterium]
MANQNSNYVDVLIVGAGLSGIGAACHLQRECPSKSVAILEGRAALGGTWDLFRYPGIRSDSDMYTLGYKFKPWKEAKAIADGPAILNYIRETAAEYGLEQKIRFNQKAVRAAWSSETAHWTVESQHSETGAVTTIVCGFLMMCSGYYSYDNGYAPDFPGAEQFQGTLIHPQHWPENLDYAGKRVVVIGSGATAVTLVPAMAETAAHVTMVQRSPTYMVALPSSDFIANTLRRVLPESLVYMLTRWKNTLFGILIYQLSQRRPEFVKRLIKDQVRKALGSDFDVERHFTPPYNPWDQRMCLVPDGDMFIAMREKRASIVTDLIETFTPTGIKLKSGEQLDADIIVTATGLNLVSLGGIEVTVDGQTAQTNKSVAYKGSLLTGIPNLAFVFGYTNASWTLKADLICTFVCRLLNYMDKHGYRQVTPHLNDPAVEDLPLLNLTSGYILRAMDRFPRQGSKLPWRLYQNYVLDTLMIRFGSLKDEALEFKRAELPAKVGEVATA